MGPAGRTGSINLPHSEQIIFYFPISIKTQSQSEHCAQVDIQRSQSKTYETYKEQVQEDTLLCLNRGAH